MQLIARFHQATAAGLVLVTSLASLTAQVASGGVRGSTESVAAAERLLQHVGGDVWRARVMEVTERGYSASGDELELRVIRDFDAERRLFERRSSAGRLVEWVAGDRGWTEQDGQRRIMPDEERRAEHQGIRQEPYAIYHRLAIRDHSLRVELRERNSRLMVFERDDRLLCWFRLDAKGVPIGWGNFFDGQINEHFYGPLASFGTIKLPRWGVSTTGAFRFEYLRARMSQQPLQEPRD